MDRRKFIRQSTAAAVGGVASTSLLKATVPAGNAEAMGMKTFTNVAPRAITMWDFSWLERRWPGAGYENWDQALDELIVRGYNAIRLDAYPHLIGANPTKKWMLHEVWNQQIWGSPDMNEVQVQPYLNEFLYKCSLRDIKVGLSSWYRQDVDETRLTQDTPEKQAGAWLATLKSIEKDGLMDTILYVDLCNEWPGDAWALFFSKQYPEVGWGQWFKPASMEWMKRALKIMKENYPDMPFIYSFDTEDVSTYEQVDCSFLDFIEHHIWMAQQNGGEFFQETGYDYGRFTPIGYKNLAANGERVYRERPEYWQGLLTKRINQMGDIARRLRRPVVTTESWGVVDYKDWPLLKWDWVKELCALGAKTAAATGMWAGINTSNFCGPQFVGMWRDIQWHQEITRIIRTSKLDDSITTNNEVAAKLLKRL